MLCHTYIKKGKDEIVVEAGKAGRETHRCEKRKKGNVVSRASPHSSLAISIPGARGKIALTTILLASARGTCTVGVSEI